MSGENIRDRIGSLSRAELLGIALLMAVLLGGAGLWYVRSLPKPIQVRAEAATQTVEVVPSGSPSPQIVLVDVAGWVRQPGVYEFPAGSRVVDAIEAAGGPRRGAALEQLNLAAPLTDGTQILVNRRGSDPGVAGGVPGSVSSGGSVPGTVNVNTASATELEALPGVGEVIAQRIVDYRTANGPFSSVDELLEVSGIGDATLASMRELVSV
jgi:competence protein ComEA